MSSSLRFSVQALIDPTSSSTPLLVNGTVAVFRIGTPGESKILPAVFADAHKLLLLHELPDKVINQGIDILGIQNLGKGLAVNNPEAHGLELKLKGI